MNLVLAFYTYGQSNTWVGVILSSDVGNIHTNFGLKSEGSYFMLGKQICREKQ